MWNSVYVSEDVLWQGCQIVCGIFIFVFKHQMSCVTLHLWSTYSKSYFMVSGCSRNVQCSPMWVCGTTWVKGSFQIWRYAVTIVIEKLEPFMSKYKSYFFFLFFLNFRPQESLWNSVKSSPSSYKETWWTIWSSRLWETSRKLHFSLSHWCEHLFSSFMKGFPQSVCSYYTFAYSFERALTSNARHGAFSFLKF